MGEAGALGRAEGRAADAGTKVAEAVPAREGAEDAWEEDAMSSLSV